jgi:hypothetical protein
MRRKEMIKGNAKMEFGTGDILMTSVWSHDIGALCCVNQEPHEIGDLVTVTSTWNADNADVILTFTKVESIDAVIARLKELRAIMDGTYDFSTGIYTDTDISFDNFLKMNTEPQKDQLKEYLNNKYGKGSYRD